MANKHTKKIEKYKNKIKKFKNKIEKIKYTENFTTKTVGGDTELSPGAIIGIIAGSLFGAAGFLMYLNHRAVTPRPRRPVE
jgi:hypothetical protein